MGKKLARPYDSITNEYVERELQKLQEEQELLRQSKGMGGPTDKMPTTGGSGQFGPAEFKYGGIHIKPENKGKFNATKARTGKTTEELTHSSNPLTRKRAIFAQNAKKWKHGGEDETSFLVKPKSMLEWEQEYPDYNQTATPIYPTSVDNPTYSPLSPYNTYKEMNLAGRVPDLKTRTVPVSDETQKQKFDWGEAGVLGAQLAGDIVGLGYSLKKPNYAKYQRISPSLVNYNQAATDITNQAALLENSAAGALRNQGQSSGAYLNNRINLASRLGQQTGAQLAELRMNEANTNVGIKNEALTRNAEIQRAETETNAREKDAKMQALVGHLGGLGSKVAGYSRDKNQTKLDKQQFETMLKLYPYLFRDKEVLKLIQEQAGK